MLFRFQCSFPMGILSRSIFRETAASALLGSLLFTFVLFLQRLTKLFEILVRSSAPPATVGKLFALAVPFTLAFTIPLGVLVGVLIALSRMSSDGEITAIRAAGVSSRRVITPVLGLAFFGMAVTATASLWLTPLSLWKTDRIVNRLLAAELTADVQPRIFEEQFPNTILYVGDVIQGPVAKWRNVFMADLTPPGQRKGDGRERADAPRIIVATEALAMPDVAHNRIQLSLLHGATHEVGKDTEYYSTGFAHQEQLLDAQRPGEIRVARAVTELDTVPLFHLAYRDKTAESAKVVEARVEFQQRIALPPACILLALVGIPLGVSSRKGGKSSAFVLTLALAFFYWMAMITLIGLARQSKLSVEVAAWIPNAVFALIGVALIAGMETPGDRDWVGKLSRWGASQSEWLRRNLPSAPSGIGARRGSVRFPLFPMLIDTYVLTSFLFYFAVLLTSFVLMTEVFTFFELLSDIIRNHIAMDRVLTYLFFLGPKLIYDSTPISVLVAVLITFGILTKNNEVTALKACGISLYRLAIPVLLTATVLSGGLFAFDHYYVPDANRKQDAIRNEIKGRPVQTYLRPDRKWIVGKGSRIYYYKVFDPISRVMGGVSVYELDPATYRLTRHISAERAHWEPTLHAWIFENGWSRTLDTGAKGGAERVVDFTGKATTFPELDEPPDYFLKEVLQYKQMNFQQLAGYIAELKQSGFETVALQVQFYRKFAVPLFALIMAIISVPFAFVTGNRGAMAGVGVSFGIAVAYFSVSLLFEQIGNVNLLPAAAAAWAPDALFALAGLYFFTHMRT